MRWTKNCNSCSWHSLVIKSESEVAPSCLTLCDPVDCSPPGSSIHGILQTRTLEWVASSFSRGSSQPRDRTWVSCIAGKCFNHQGSSTGHQKGPSFSPHHLTICHTTNTSKAEQIGLQNFALSAIFTWPLISTTFHRGNTSTSSRRQKMLSKRVHWISKHGFLCYGNKQTYFSLAKKHVDCNGSYFD